ncbi:MAG: hypothetical protein WBP93_18500 [Pyrinomonadaceae bacterium]
MSFPVKRADQACVIISEPILYVKHYTIVEVKGVFVNFSPEDIYIAATGFGLVPQATPGIKAVGNQNTPSTLAAHSSTGEILLITLEINRDAFDPIENMMIGTYHLQYTDSSSASYLTAPALFQLLLQ